MIIREIARPGFNWNCFDFFNNFGDTYRWLLEVKLFDIAETLKKAKDSNDKTLLSNQSRPNERTMA